MRRLPLYESAPATPLERGPTLQLTPGACTRCQLGAISLSRGLKSCMPAELVEGKEPSRGTLYVLGDAPTPHEGEHGRPMLSNAGRAVRRVVEKYWPGNYVLDNATRCASAGPSHQASAHAACAPYLRQVFQDALPDRIIVLGRVAAKAVLGRDVPPDDTRKGYSWVRRPDDVRIPLMVLAHPAQVMRNRHLVKNLEEDFAWALGPLDDLMAPLDDAMFHLVETLEDAKEACEALRAYDWLAYDCETAGKHYSDFFEVACVSCTAAEDDLTYVWGPTALKNIAAVALLRDLIEDEVVGKTGANYKYDSLSLRAAFNMRSAGFVLDVQLTKHLDSPGSDASLETQSELVGMGGYKQEFARKLDGVKESIRRGRKKSAAGRQLPLLPENPVFLAAINHPEESPDTYAYALIPTPDLERYCARDTVCTARLARGRYGFALVQQGSPHRNIWRNLLRRTPDAVEQIEAWGIGVSRDGIDNFKRYIEGELATVTKRIDRYDINPASPQQVAALLFDQLKLKNPQNPGARSTDKKALFAMAGQHPVVADLREHRRLFKLRGSYGNLDAFIREDGRIHCEFKLDGAATGRLSCVSPGLHQLPRKDDGDGHTEGKLIKDCFAAAPGYKLVQLDESQIELRTAAALSQDPVMLEMFRSGKDFHFQTAQRIAPIMWKMKPEDVGDAQRSVAKIFNFGLMYGMTDPGMAARLNCTIEVAARLRAAVLGEFKALARWIRAQVAYVQANGHIVTPFLWQPGRVRPLPDIALDTSDKVLRGRQRTAENGSFNTPCQSLGSDIVLSALTDIVDWLQHDPTMDARVVLTVHDSIVAEVREDHVERYIEVARPLMTSYDLRGVPLVVDVEVGEALGSLSKVKLPTAQKAA